MLHFLLLPLITFACLYSPFASAACPLGGCWDGNTEPYPICVCDADGLCAESCGLKGDDYTFNTDSCTCDYIGSCPGDGCYDPYTCDCDPSGQCYIECYQRGEGWEWSDDSCSCVEAEPLGDWCQDQGGYWHWCQWEQEWVCRYHYPCTRCPHFSVMCASEISEHWQTPSP